MNILYPTQEKEKTTFFGDQQIKKIVLVVDEIPSQTVMEIMCERVSEGKPVNIETLYAKMNESMEEKGIDSEHNSFLKFLGTSKRDIYKRRKVRLQNVLFDCYNKQYNV